MCGWSKGGSAPTHMNSFEPTSMRFSPSVLWKCGVEVCAMGSVFRPGFELAGAYPTHGAKGRRGRESAYLWWPATDRANIGRSLAPMEEVGMRTTFVAVA